MRVIRLRRLATAVMVVALAAPAAAQANAVTTWNKIAADTLIVFPGPAGGAPPALQLNMAMTQGAVYDAVNSIEPRHTSYLLATRFNSLASKDTAVATAAYLVLSNIVATVPATITFNNRAALLADLAAKYAASVPAAPTPLEQAGIDAGTAAANAMITARQGDGRFGASQWKGQTGPGYWQPLNGALDPTPWVGGVKPFMVQSASQFRTDGPQALDSAAWAEDFNEVKKLGSINSTARTPEQTHIALWWQALTGGPGLMWNAVARNLADDPSNGVDLGDSALLFGMLNLAGADAAITVWSDKYYWDFWRPWQAIHEAASDGNSATEPDASWTALLVAPYPEHPSGHLGLDGSMLPVLQMFFGDKVQFSVTSNRFPNETRTFDRFSEPLKEIIDARIWAGLHYRTADVQSKVLGKKVVHYMAKNYFQPLDMD